ncbi:MAG: hypothetical protein JSV96_13080 [Candidatus Aminicenantes bacterium]|nr:MAG: hypothetical protein JSV96_13080 [Candidatus Aminicenantes bacterium]
MRFNIQIVSFIILGIFILTLPIYSAPQELTEKTIKLISGNGEYGEQDPFNYWREEEKKAYRNAYIMIEWIVENRGFYVIDGTKYINYNNTNLGENDTSIFYKTTFVLPADFSGPSLEILIRANDAATIWLNGEHIFSNDRGPATPEEVTKNFRIAPPTIQFDPPTNVLYPFQEGINTIDIEVYNLWGGTGLDYKITVKYFQPASADDGIEGLLNDVLELHNSGVLNKGQANALVKKLEAASKNLNKGKPKAACNEIQAFINQVNALINSGKLSPEEGDPLIEAAIMLIDEICG